MIGGMKRWLLMAALAGTLAPLGADVLQPLGDEFGNAASISRWSDLNAVEGWVCNQLELWNVNNSTPGHMRMMPRTSTWYNNLKGVLVHKLITGDFIATAHLFIYSRHNPADPLELPNRLFSLAGIFARAPRGFTRGAPDPYTTAAVWPPASFGSQWTANGENYIFLSFGSAGAVNARQFEIKTTRNSSSILYYNSTGVPQGTGAGSNEVWLQLVRVGNTVVGLRKHGAAAPWIAENRYPNSDHPFPVWGSTLQVGITTYTDWDTILPTYFNGGNVQTQFWHNYIEISGQPDLIADVDYLRFERPNAALTEPVLQAMSVSYNPVTHSTSNPSVLLSASPGVSPYLGDNSNTPLGDVAFSAPDYTVNETAGSAAIIVTRSGNSTDKPLSLQYATSNGTAMAGADYTGTSGTLSWGSNDSADKTITIPVNPNDGLAEGDENLTVTINQLDGPATFAASAPTLSATITLQDSPRDAWRLAQFGANANGAAGQLTADPDLDGLRNLLEYALGSSPNIASTSPLPVAGTGGGHLSLSFTCNTAATDVSLTVESSDDLAAWSPIATRAAGAASWTNVGALSAGENGSGVVTVVDSANTSPGSRRFIRLRVDAP